MVRIVSAGLAAFVVVGLASAAEAKNPWEELMGRKPKVWQDPAGRFSLDLPVGWTAHADPEGSVSRFVRAHEQTGLTAEVQVEIRPLPPGVRAAHLDAQIQADNVERAPGYLLRDRQTTSVAGHRAVQTLFTYRARGNAELGREAVQTVFVAGERGFVVTLETIGGARSLFWEEFDLMLKGFSTGGPRPAPTSGQASRRRVRAGEMVNPDAVGY